MARVINVFFDGEIVGTLDRVLDGSSLKYRFQYLPGIDENKLVSLTMPVREAPYVVANMPASFDMIMPEGERRETIAKLSKLSNMTELDLLAIVGSNTIGRIQFSQTDSLDKPVAFDHDAISLCENGKKLFAKLLEDNGYKSGVSGVQPKVLAQAMSAEEEAEQRTLVSSTDIIKSASDEYPHLVLNEYSCLEAAKLSGIVVPEYDLSSDGTLLAIKRFDLQEDGSHHLGFEEICALMNQPSDHKYFGSYDQIALEIEENVFGEQGLSDIHAFYKQLAFMVLTRNGDAHLKNFGLLYDSEQSHLSPAYDLITTTVYEPNDIPALNLSDSNFSKRWWRKDELIAFGQEYCSLNKKQITAIFNDIEQGLHLAAKQMDDTVARFPEFAVTANKMKTVWSNALEEYDLQPLPQEPKYAAGAP